MAYAEELLELAQELASLHPDSPRQPSLRRAVSTAYYALFHLLISEATANWRRPELRAALGRVFDHGPMKQAADKKVMEVNNYLKTKPPEGPEKTIALHLRNVAETCGEAQYHGRRLCWRCRGRVGTALKTQARLSFPMRVSPEMVRESAAW